MTPSEKFQAGRAYIRATSLGDRIHPVPEDLRQWWFTTGFPKGSGLMTMENQLIVVESVREYLLTGQFVVLAHLGEAVVPPPPPKEELSEPTPAPDMPEMGHQEPLL